MIPKEKQETNTKRGIQEREKMKERSGDLERIYIGCGRKGNI